jgi:alpha-L-rhamnosidase
MKPHPVGDLKFARATHHSPYGLITSDWRKTDLTKQGGERFEWSVEIPANTTATVYVPAMPRRIVTESGQPVEQMRGAKLLNSGADRIVFQLASGKYKLISE